MITYFCKTCDCTITVTQDTILCPYCTTYIHVNGKIEDIPREGTTSNDGPRDNC